MPYYTRVNVEDLEKSVGYEELPQKILYTNLMDCQLNLEPNERIISVQFQDRKTQEVINLKVINHADLHIAHTNDDNMMGEIYYVNYNPNSEEIDLVTTGYFNGNQKSCEVEEFLESTRDGCLRSFVDIETKETVATKIRREEREEREKLVAKTEQDKREANLNRYRRKFSSTANVKEQGLFPAKMTKTNSSPSLGRNKSSAIESPKK